MHTPDTRPADAQPGNNGPAGRDAREVRAADADAPDARPADMHGRAVHAGASRAIRPGARLNLVLGALLVIGLAWASAGDRLVSSIAYAVERGRIQASAQELAELQNGIPELSAVARAFKLVARVARPGVVHIRVSGGEAPALSERQIEEFLRRHLGQVVPEPGDEEGGDQERNPETQRNRQRRERGDSDEPAPQSRRGRRPNRAPAPDSDGNRTPDANRAPAPDSDGNSDANRGRDDSDDDADRLQERREQLEQLLRHMRPLPAAGSGIIFDAEGYILTNSHVVSGRTEIRVILYDDREFPAKLIGTDPKTDLAVVKIDAPDLHPLAFGDSDAVEVGDWVLAVGSPFGLTQTVTHGIVSATGRTRVPGIDIEYQNFLQTDAAINPGNSGGPLLNIRGEIVGVNTAIATHGDGVNAGIAFTIPSNRAAGIARQLKASGVVIRGWLGISFSPSIPEDVEIFGLPGPGGVFVERVLAGSPAADAGVQVEDVITHIDAVDVADTEQFRGIIADMGPDESARLRLIRDGRAVELSVRLGRQPDDMRSAGRADAADARLVRQLSLWGRTYRPRSFATRYEEAARGVLVRRVDSPGLAGQLSPGELIVGCQGEPVRCVRELQHTLADVAAGARIKLEILEPTGDRRIVLFEPTP
ncbi:MAG: trypsin-like peptidase domain-containing protein [Planctomycetota bacterium]